MVTAGNRKGTSLDVKSTSLSLSDWEISAYFWLLIAKLKTPYDTESFLLSVSTRVIRAIGSY